MNLIEKDSKKYCKISELREWDKNPRYISTNKFEKLKNRIRKSWHSGVKLFRPLVVDQDGNVLGGNMRLRAIKDLEIDDLVWVEVVHCKDDSERMDIALVDNETFGKFDTEKFLLFNESDHKLDLNDYDVIVGDPVDLTMVMNNDSNVLDDSNIDGRESISSKKSEDNSNEKSYTLKIPNSEFDNFLARINKIKIDNDFNDHYSVLNFVISKYEQSS